VAVTTHRTSELELLPGMRPILVAHPAVTTLGVSGEPPRSSTRSVPDRTAPWSAETPEQGPGTPLSRMAPAANRGLSSVTSRQCSEALGLRRDPSAGRRSWGHRLTRFLVSASALFACLVSSGPAALAHTVLVRSDPVDGATLVHPPTRVTLWFTEPLRLELSSFSIMSLDGTAVRPTTIRQVGSQGNVVIIELPSLDDAVYTVSWKALSATDTHVTTGTLLFGVGQEVARSVATTGHVEQPIDAIGVGLRWLDVIALATIIGSLLVTPWILSRGKERIADLRRDAAKRALRLAAVSTTAALILGFCLLVWQADEIRSSLPGKGSHWVSTGAMLLFDGRWAFLWWTRQGILLVLLLLTMRLGKVGRRRAPAAGWVGGGLLLAALALVRASGGHAASLPSGVQIAVLVDAAHLLAAGVWIGGLISLAGATFPHLRAHGGRDLLVETWKRFGTVAAISFGVLAASGLYEASRQIASPDAALRTTYGVVLIDKVILGLVVGAIGLANWAILRPEVKRRLRRVLGRAVPNSTADASALGRFRKRVAVEVSAAVGLFLLAALMGSSAPARGPAFRHRDPAPSSSVVQVNDLLVKLSVKPNVPGKNLLSIAPVSTRRPSPGVVTGAMVKVGGSDGDTTTIELAPGVDGEFRLGWEIDRSGPLPIEARLARDGLPDVVARFTWVVGDGSPTTPSVYSSRALGPILRQASVLVLSVTGVGAAWCWRARRRTRRRAASTRGPVGDTALEIIDTVGAFPETPGDRVRPHASSGARRGEA
jgi:copper transport protein